MDKYPKLHELQREEISSVLTIPYLYLMIIHEETLISEDILDKEFICDLDKCKGACCVEGDIGAPLEQGEIDLINDNLDHIMPYMNNAGLKLLAMRGFHERDPDGDLVTTCVQGRDCVFAIREEGIYKCAIEKSYLEGKSTFIKPISCHLYPIRLEKVHDMTALNYSRWYICSPACALGKRERVSIYQFLKGPLIRRFGDSWYAGLEEIAVQWESARGKKR